MNPRVARWSGGAILLAVAGALGILVLLSTGTVLVSQRGALGGSLVHAEFRNAAPLVPGMSIRVSGVVAGTVEDVALTDHGTATVALRLARGVPVPRADASAAIRQQDLLGDSYVSLALGTARAPLHGPIPVARTLALPRLDELFSTFRAPVRDGLKALLVELGTAVERRGQDLNGAILKLRPGFAALDDLFGELDGQRDALRSVVTSAEHVTRQLASRSAELGDGVTALDRTLQAARRRAPELDAALAAAPAALQTGRGTLTRLASVARRSQPLAQTAAAAAPDLNRTVARLGAWAADARVSAGSVAPVLTALRRTLTAARPITKELAHVDPVDVLLPAAGLLAVLAPVFADGADALFGADSYGKDPKGETGLGAVAVESGAQPTAPAQDPARTWIRVATVLSCETFGVAVKPGCLVDAISGGRAGGARKQSGATPAKSPTTAPANEHPPAATTTAPAPPATTPPVAAPPTPRPAAPRLPAVVQQLLDLLPGGRQDPGHDAARPLLDFLLG